MRKAYLFRRPRRLAGYWRLTITSFALGAAAVLLMPDNATPTVDQTIALSHAAWPEAPNIPRTVRLEHGVADKDCADFRSQADTQAFLGASGPGDPHRLDGDDDGVACQRLP
jgi:hypothetical protein